MKFHKGQHCERIATRWTGDADGFWKALPTLSYVVRYPCDVEAVRAGEAVALRDRLIGSLRVMSLGETAYGFTAGDINVDAAFNKVCNGTPDSRELVQFDRIGSDDDWVMYQYTDDPEVVVAIRIVEDNNELG